MAHADQWTCAQIGCVQLSRDGSGLYERAQWPSPARTANDCTSSRVKRPLVYRLVIDGLVFDGSSVCPNVASAVAAMCMPRGGGCKEAFAYVSNVSALENSVAARVRLVSWSHGACRIATPAKARRCENVVYAGGEVSMQGELIQKALMLFHVTTGRGPVDPRRDDVVL